MRKINFKGKRADKSCVVCGSTDLKGINDLRPSFTIGVCLECRQTGRFELWVDEDPQRFAKMSPRDSNVYDKYLHDVRYELSIANSFHNMFNDNFIDMGIAQIAIQHGGANPWDYLYKIIENWEEQYTSNTSLNSKTINILHEMSKRRIANIERHIDWLHGERTKK